MVGVTHNLTTEVVVAVATISVLTTLGWFCYRRKKKNGIPTVWKPVGRVKSLCIYPLKSGHRTELQTAICTKFGFKMPDNGVGFQLCDRNVVIYKENNNELRTARQYPKMVFIKTTSSSKSNFIVNAPDMPTLKVEIPSLNKNSKKINITLHRGEPVTTLDCGNEAAEWISKYLLNDVSGLRMGFHDGVCERKINQTYEKYLSIYSRLRNEAGGMYTDLTSYLVVNQASVDDLNSRVADTNITEHYFRPNILVEGDNAPPYAEDDWEWVKIGDVVLYMARYCTRCIFTLINPETATKSPTNEPLATLNTYRLLKQIKNIDLDGNLAVMGNHMGLQIGGEISVGDAVYVGRSS